MSDVTNNYVPRLRKCAFELRMHRTHRVKDCSTCNIWGSEGVLGAQQSHVRIANGHLGLITFVRSPVTHLLSQFSHCQSPKGVAYSAKQERL